MVAHGKWDRLAPRWNVNGLGWNSNISPEVLDSAALLHWNGRSESLCLSPNPLDPPTYEDLLIGLHGNFSFCTRKALAARWSTPEVVGGAFSD